MKDWFCPPLFGDIAQAFNKRTDSMKHQKFVAVVAVWLQLVCHHRVGSGPDLLEQLKPFGKSTRECSARPPPYGITKPAAALSSAASDPRGGSCLDLIFKTQAACCCHVCCDCTFTYLLILLSTSTWLKLVQHSISTGKIWDFDVQLQQLMQAEETSMDFLKNRTRQTRQCLIYSGITCSIHVSWPHHVMMRR